MTFNSKNPYRTPGEPWRMGCPVCDNSAIYWRKTSGEFQCKSCGDVFNVPIDRNTGELAKITNGGL